LVAVFPSLIFVAARITNDVLYQFLGVLFLALLVRWWQKPEWKIWYALAALTGICLITKVSATAFLPALFLILLCRSKIQWRSKILHGIAGLLVITLISGWLPVLRLYVEEDTSRTLSLGNQGMNGGLTLSNAPEHFLTFNPLEVLRHPYNNPWDDAYRRQYFWEYFYRSAFTGEFSFNDRLRDLNKLILLTGMCAAALLLYGCIMEIVRSPKKTFPLWLMLMLLIAASLSYRFRFAYSANQDFRFVVMAVIPLSYFAVRGALSLPMFLRPLGKTLLLFFSVSCALFFTGLAFFPS
jgi:4-amino-4-deoxy-L-arabinose transferase-like glycosyltransferase